jgi:hypothetical protein
MLIIFFDYEDMVHHEFVPQGQTVNKEFHLEVLRRLRESIRKKNVGIVEGKATDSPP